MNLPQSNLLAIASAAILVVTAIGCESTNTQAKSTQIQPSSSESISPVGSVIDRDSALNAVWQLRQVQQKIQEIERLSRGKARVGLKLDHSPTTAEPYYVVQLFEERPERITTINWFRVSPEGVITVLDISTDKYISLDEWKP